VGAPQLRHALMRAPTPAEALALLQRAEAELTAAGGGPVRSVASPAWAH
jgi:hypothetical protein